MSPAAARLPEGTGNEGSRARAAPMSCPSVNACALKGVGRATFLWCHCTYGGVWLREDEIRSVEGPDARRGGPEGTAPLVATGTTTPPYSRLGRPAQQRLRNGGSATAAPHTATPTPVFYIPITSPDDRRSGR